MHLRTEPMPLEYVYYLKLAHGVTTMVPGSDRGLKSGMDRSFDFDSFSFINK